MAQESCLQLAWGSLDRSSMKFLSTWLRNACLGEEAVGAGESSMKFLSTWLRNHLGRGLADGNTPLLNEVPEHMAQEYARKENKPRTWLVPQ